MHQNPITVGRHAIMQLRDLLLNPLFLAGLALKLSFAFYFNPEPVSEWFAPFLELSIQKFSFDPWATWIKLGGSPLAFPYGHAMWASFLPIVAVFNIFGAPISIAYKLTLLLADFFLLLVLSRLAEKNLNSLLIIFWFSPIMIIACYFLGSNDVVPTLLLFFTVLKVRNVQLKTAGVTLALAASAKLSMILTVPFFLVYLYTNPAVRQHAIQFYVSLTITSLIIASFFLVSQNGMSMLFNNPEMGSAFKLSLEMPGGKKIYLSVLLYALTVYAFWRIGRLNFDLFQSAIGIGLLLFVLITPSSMGWFIWCLPFIVLYQMESDRTGTFLFVAFSITYATACFPFFDPTITETLSSSRDWFGVTLAEGLNQFSTVNYTILIATGCAIIVKVWEKKFVRGDFYRVNRKPLVIGLAGDSGTGKDTLVNSLCGVFGQHSISKISGDDYHLWERQKPIWRVLSHLNPIANDLERFQRDVISLADGRNIHTRHYDHKVGRMTQRVLIQPRPIIIASGLHALYSPLLREFYSLKIYLDMNESFRKLLKIKRDVYQRGHSVEKVTETILQRAPDAIRFINPQAEHADLIFSIQPVNQDILNEALYTADKTAEFDPNKLALKLIITSKSGLIDMSLQRVLIGVCGLNVVTTVVNNEQKIEMIVEGEISEQDVEIAFKILCSSLKDFIDSPPKWESGLLGLMQLITLVHIKQIFTKRLVE